MDNIKQVGSGISSTQKDCAIISYDQTDLNQTDGTRNCSRKRTFPTEECESRSSSQNIVKKLCRVCQDVNLYEEAATFSQRSEIPAPKTMELPPNQSRLSPSPALKISKQAPFFEGTAVWDGQFVNISINDYKGQYLILFFYPLDFTFVCPTEIIAFSERLSEFTNIGCKIVGCSTDSQYSHLAWMNNDRKNGGIGKLNYPLLSDKSMSIARSYGVLDEDTGVPFRGLFIIDPNQNLRQIIINDLPVGRSVDEALRLVQAIQFTDANGEVCPVNWKPGNRTIVPDPTASLEFFKTTNPKLY